MSLHGDNGHVMPASFPSDFPLCLTTVRRVGFTDVTLLADGDTDPIASKRGCAGEERLMVMSNRCMASHYDVSATKRGRPRVQRGGRSCAHLGPPRDPGQQGHLARSAAGEEGTCHSRTKVVGPALFLRCKLRQHNKYAHSDYVSQPCSRKLAR